MVVDEDIEFVLMIEEGEYGLQMQGFLWRRFRSYNNFRMDLVGCVDWSTLLSYGMKMVAIMKLFVDLLT